MLNKEIARLRLINQSIAAPRFDSPEAVVQWFVAMQAQDYGQALWAIGLRTRSATKADVERAVSDGTIVRTWPMRGTIHFVAPRDAKWMLKLMTPRMISGSKSRRINLGLTDAMLAKAADVAAATLAGGKRLARPDMLQIFEDAGISTNDGRGYHILWYLSQTGLLCIGPMDGKQQTFTLLDEWASDAIELTREESLGELAARYFAAHGPATIADFAWWTGLPMREARIGLERAKDKLVSMTTDGNEYWLSRDAQDEADVGGVYLLAGFDEFLLGYKDRSAVIATGSAPAYVNGIFFPIIVIDGEVIGLWKRTIKSKYAELTLEPFHPLSAHHQQRVQEAAAKYHEFIGLPLKFAAK